MHKITEQIWIGGSAAASQHQPLINEGIRFILNCAEDLPEQLSWRDGFTHFHCGMRDSDNHPSLYESAIGILTAITSKPENKVLVHCHEGRSRSVYVVACFLVKKGLHQKVEDALEFIREKGRDVKVAKGHLDSYQP